MAKRAHRRIAQVSGANLPRQHPVYPHAQYGVDTSAIPDYVEPFTAYRAWNWTETSLTSLNNEPWSPKVAFEAVCGKNEAFKQLFVNPPPTTWVPAFEDNYKIHPVPDENCTCGMYAGINMQHLIDIGYIERGVHGEVSLWGRLQRCSLGWRAQYAYPKNFVVPANMLPWELRTFEKRMEILIAFDVDIYLQPDRTATVGQEKFPLWVKGYGYSQQGLDWIILQRAQWKAPVIEAIKAGDRIAVLHERGGIGIVRVVSSDFIYYELFGTQVFKVPLKSVRWNRSNWRWETGTLGVTRSTGLTNGV